MRKIHHPILAFLLPAFVAICFCGEAVAQVPPKPNQEIERETLSQLQTDSSTTEALQSSAERAIDWLDKQIGPPATGEGSGGLAIFSDPKTKRSAIKTGATLTLVISLFLMVVFLLKLRPGASKSSGRAGRRRRSGVPAEAVSILGQIPYVEGQQLQLIRLGSRLLLVATSANGSSTLGEIVDPEEVWQIETACREGRVDGLADSLRRRTRPLGNAPSNGMPGVSLGSHQRGGRTLLEA